MSTNPQVQRLVGLPRRPEHVWEGGIVRLPVRVRGPDGREVEPAASMWMDCRTGAVHMSQMRPAEEVGLPDLLSTLADFACNQKLAGFRPGGLEVSDPAAAEMLRRELEGLEIEVRLVPSLSVVGPLLSDLATKLSGATAPGPLSEVPGMTQSAIRSFAEAAALFHAARPWTKLTDEDLIEVVSPKVDKGLRHFVVMGGGGQEFGLSFFPTMRDFRTFINSDDPIALVEKKPLWSVTFVGADVAPPGDVVLWDTLGLPRTSDGQLPFPSQYSGGGWRRPDPQQLSQMAMLLRAMAAVTDEQLDSPSGQWKTEVPTANGPARITLRQVNPFAMEQMREMGEMLVQLIDSGATPGDLQAAAKRDLTASEQAQVLVEQARHSTPRRSLKLAREAIRLDPDCVDAYIAMSEASPSAGESEKFLRQAVEVGERALGEKFFEKNTGHFWGLLETRPYMRAMESLAALLHVSGRTDQAIPIWRRMLQLNPNDNQGMRDSLALALLAQGRNDELQVLLDQYRKDWGAAHAYSLALLRYRQQGDSPEARKALADAIKVNRHMPAYLSGRRGLPREVPEVYSPGEPSEAESFGHELAPAWQATPGAVDWLKANAKAPPKPPRGRTRRSRR